MTRTVTIALLLALACACSAPTSQSPAAAAAPVAAPVPPTTMSVAALPPAPPLDEWVVNGSDFQQTLDLRMRTELIELGIGPATATDAAARDLAFHICSGLRAHRAPIYELVREAYPQADSPRLVGIGLAAKGYCLDAM